MRHFTGESHHLNHLKHIADHQQYYYHHGGFGLWHIISLILGLLLLCFLIGVCISCFRNTAYAAGAPMGGVYL